MKYAGAMAPIGVIEQPKFMAGYLYGMSLPACLVRIQLSPDSENVLANIEDTLNKFIGKPEVQSVVAGSSFSGIAAKIAAWCLEAQNRCGLIIHRNFRVQGLMPMQDGSAHITLVLPYRFVQPAMAAFSLVIGLINKLATEKIATADINAMVSARVKQIRKFRESGQNVPDLLNFAITKQIPFQRIEGQTYRFGIGGAQCILESTFTEKTPALGVKLCKNKLSAAKILNDSGFPGGAPVRVHKVEEAIQAAGELGYPVVVKPVDSDGGVGVSADLRNEEDLIQAFAAARQASPHVMVDRHVEGTGHRFTIMFGKVVKVTAKKPWGVTGDGVSTVAELVDKQSSSPIEGGAFEAASDAVPCLDEEALSMLRQHQWTPESVPAAGEFVVLRRRNNANAGGSTRLLDPAQVHEDNLRLALRVAGLFMLDVAGIDLIIPDIHRSWLEQDCLICDVNSKPQVGTSTAADFLDELMRGGSRIPVTLVLFSGASSPVRNPDVQKLLRQLNIDGVASAEGIWIHGLQIGRTVSGGFGAAKALLSQRDIFNAAMVMSVDELNASGLPADRFQRLLLVGASAPNSQNAKLQLHAAGEVDRETVESDIFQFGLAETPLKAASLVQKIWLHFGPGE